MIVDHVNILCDEMLKTENHREYSWDYCYSCFSHAINERIDNYEFLSLNLAFYLASFGMYRGSSFLLKRDYLIHLPAVKIIVDSRYKSLLGIECNEWTEEFNVLLKELYCRLDEYYSKTMNKKSSGGDGTSRILLTKILLGTLGCIPAIDEYVLKASRALGIINKGDDVWKIHGKFIEYYERNRNELDEKRQQMIVRGTGELYPEMRILDMGLWMYGYQI